MQKSRTTIFRNLILALTLAVCIFIAVIAWFSNYEQATASGLSVTSVKTIGLEAAFEDVDDQYSYNLVDNLSQTFSLITGNGDSFFIPAMDKTNGNPLVDSSGKWLPKKLPVANKDYYEKDIFFRSDEELEVYLQDTSKVVPNDIANGTLNNKSDFGNFTRDYIAGASRVAFYSVNDSNEETLAFVWVPNSTYELIDSSEFVKIQKTSVGTGDFDRVNPENTFGITDLPQSDYYIWEGQVTDRGNDIQNVQSSRFRYDSTTGEYKAAIDMYSSTVLDHAILVNKSSSQSSARINSNFSGTKQSTQCYMGPYVLNGHSYEYIGGYFDGKRYINFPGEAQSYSWSKMSIDANPNKSQFFKDVDRFQVLVTYNSANGSMKVSGFVFYNSTTGEYGGGTGEGTTTQEYVLNDGKDIVITATSNSEYYAITANGDQISSSVVSVESGNKISSASANMMFEVQIVVDDSKSVYLKSAITDKYLSVNGSQVTLSDKPTAFRIFTGTNGPLISYNGMYINYSGGSFILNSSQSELTVFEGSKNGFNENGTPESSYQYYDSTTDTVENLSNFVTDLSTIANNPVTKLSKKENDNYYKSHIRIKIWTEGTDREAKIPLAEGVFNSILNFEGKPIVTP